MPSAPPLPSTPPLPPTTRLPSRPTRSPAPARRPDPPGPPAPGCLTRRLAVLVASGAGAAVLSLLTMAPTAPAGPAPASPAAAHRSEVLQLRVAGTPASGIHIESVSAPVLLTAAQLQEAEAEAAPPAAAPAPPPSARPATAATSGASGPGPGTDLGTFTVTCYDNHGRTASGDEAGPQSVAVDPSVIPLGSHLYIAGVGYRVADDTGGAVRGHHIDIWESSYSACAEFGHEYRDVRRV